MFGSNEQDREQRYEYKTIDLNTATNPTWKVFSGNDPEKGLNELAEKGWEYKGEVQQGGATAYLIFERPIEE